MIFQVCLKFFQQSSQAIVKQVTVRSVGVEQGHQSVENRKSSSFCSKCKKFKLQILSRRSQYLIIAVMDSRRSNQAASNMSILIGIPKVQTCTVTTTRDLWSKFGFSRHFQGFWPSGWSSAAKTFYSNWDELIHPHLVWNWKKLEGSK